MSDYLLSVERNRSGPSAETLAPGKSVRRYFDQSEPVRQPRAGREFGGRAVSVRVPGNGKSTLARRITVCFGQQIWLPYTLIEDGQIIKLFDAVYHEAVENRQSSLMKVASYDRRWAKVRRPTVVVGGELTMDGLEIRHDPVSNTSEAPLQLKSNCGCLLIDDFGRQRIEPSELLNRWIIPLENRIDYLTLSTGKKIRAIR